MNDNYMPVGLIEIKDALTGEVVYKTHNMIVKTGRDLILKALFDNKVAIDNAKFKKYYECANTNFLTTPSTVYADITAIQFTETTFTIDKDTYEDGIDETGLYRVFNFKITNNEASAPIQALDIVYEDIIYDNSTTKTLFSRAVIDPVYMRPNRTYVAVYKIYF